MRKETGIKLFIPCFLDQLAPQVAQAVTGLLDRLNVAWGYPEDQTCCGQFAWTVGDVATARRLMRHFLRVFAGDETILCPSASCTYMVRHCYPQLAEGPGERHAVAALAARVMELGEWLDSRGPLPWSPRFGGSLVLHQSCKARRPRVPAAPGRSCPGSKTERCSRFPPITPAAVLGGPSACSNPGSPGISAQPTWPQ